MILTAGLSPAWQQILVLDELRPGDLNRAQQAYWCGSGKVLNAAVAVHHLAGGVSAESLVLSTLGGPAFQPIDEEFAAIGVHRRWVHTTSPTRVCTTIVDRANGTATELIENAGPITAEELGEFDGAFAEAAASAAGVLLIGSLPHGAPNNYFRQLLTHVRCPVVLDIRGPELLAALEARPAVIKPNREEIEQTLGALIRTDEHMRDAVAELQRRGARGVVATSGAGDVWVAVGPEIHCISPPSIAA
ncbi:MAG TPA: PfkB family carbohydrate kinase, partial [Lacipirellula sp.]